MDDDDPRLSALMTSAVAGLDADPDRLVDSAAEQGARRVRRRRVLRLGGVGLVAVAVAGAVGLTQLRSSPDAARVASPTPTVTANGPVPFVVKDGEPAVVCGQHVHGWSPSTTAGWPGVDREEFVPALETWLSRPDVQGMYPKGLGSAATVRDAAWRVVGLDRSGALIAVGEGSRTDGGVLLDRVGDGWKVSGAGDSLRCDSQPLLATRQTNWLPMGLLGEVSRSSTNVVVGIGNAQCRTKDPTDHMRDPYIVESGDSVTVYLTIPASDEVTPAACQGNPGGSSTQWPYTLHLRTPLGDRALLDGSVYPPRVIVQAR